MVIRDRIREFRRVPARQLKANPRNWREHPERQRAALRGVLAQIGYATAVIARALPDGSLELIDGHLRAQTTPDQEVPVLVLDVTEEESNVLLATLDPLSTLADVNSEKLDELLQGLTVNSIEVTKMLDDLLKEHGPGERRDPIAEDDVPEPQSAAVSRLGDLWVLGEHRLLAGDSTKAADVDRVMAGDRADLLCSDPPYGVDYVGKTKDALEIRNDDAAGLASLLKGAFGECMRVSRPGAVWYVAAPAGPQFLTFAQELTALGIWRQTLVWVKDAMVLGHSHFHYRHEVLFYGWVPGGKVHAPPDRTRTTVLEFPRPKASHDHPTQKPVALWAELLCNSTDVGDVVYEPFSGSGTTIVACERLQRRCRAIELEPRYVDCAVRRWQRLTGREAVLSESAKTWKETAKDRGVKVTG